MTYTNQDQLPVDEDQNKLAQGDQAELLTEGEGNKPLPQDTHPPELKAGKKNFIKQLMLIVVGFLLVTAFGLILLFASQTTTMINLLQQQKIAQAIPFISTPTPQPSPTQTPKPEPKNLDEIKTYRNEFFGFEFTYPRYFYDGSETIVKNTGSGFTVAPYPSIGIFLSIRIGTDTPVEFWVDQSVNLNPNSPFRKVEDLGFQQTNSQSYHQVKIKDEWGNAEQRIFEYGEGSIILEWLNNNGETVAESFKLFEPTSQVYRNPEFGVSFRIPEGYSVTTDTKDLIEVDIDFQDQTYVTISKGYSIDPNQISSSKDCKEDDQICLTHRELSYEGDVESIRTGTAIEFTTKCGVDCLYRYVQFKDHEVELKMNIAGGGLSLDFENILNSITFEDNKSNESIYCGGIAAIQCPDGFTCELDGDYPNAGGTCVED